MSGTKPIPDEKLDILLERAAYKAKANSLISAGYHNDIVIMLIKEIRRLKKSPVAITAKHLRKYIRG